MTTTNKKPTKTMRFNELLAIEAVASNPELVAFIEHEKELLMRKNANTGEKKPTKDQIANEGYKSAILSILGNKSMTIGEICKAWTDTTVDMTSQKCTSLVTQLYRANIVERTEVKGKAYFSIAPNPEVEED